MSKEEFLKIQTCVLKVSIHCDGCKHKVKKILQKIDGVYTIKIDSDLGKVTVSGNVDPPTLIKKLGKNGKHAELWGKPNQNQSQDQFKNLQFDNGKGGNGNNLPKGGQNGQKGMGAINPPPKGGQNGQIPNQQQQMMQQLKAFQDMKLPQLKDMKMPMGPPIKDQNQKNVKFNLPEDDDDLSDGEFEGEYDDDEDDFDDDDELDDDDEMDDLPSKMKPLMGNGPIPSNMMMHPQMMGKIGNLGGGGKNGEKGGPGGGPIQISIGDGKSGKKGGGGGGGNGNIGQIQGGGKNGNGGGGAGKIGNNGGGGGQGKGNGGGGQNGNLNMNGGKKGGMSDGVQGLPNMGSGFNGMGGGNVGQLGNMSMGPFGQGPMAPMSSHALMGQVPAVQGLPASAIGGGGGGYFTGAGAEPPVRNPSQQQQMAAMMMNQQRANGNERFQPMMYARPPPAVNYMPPYPYPYPYPYPPPGEPYAHAFSDENTSSCIVM